MNREEQLRAAWYEAHQGLRDYLEPWSDIDTARRLASHACGIWVQMAADGVSLSAGPYASLYACAYQTLTALSLTFEIPTDAIALSAVPVNTTLLPYQLSKIYVDVWKAAQLLHWDRRHIHRLAVGLGTVYPVTPHDWAELGSQPLGNMVPPLARRAVEVLEDHQCLDCQICAAGALRWEDADRATERWFTDQRLEREEAACPTEERSPSQ